MRLAAYDKTRLGVAQCELPAKRHVSAGYTEKWFAGSRQTKG